MICNAQMTFGNQDTNFDMIVYVTSFPFERVSPPARCFIRGRFVMAAASVLALPVIAAMFMKCVLSTSCPRLPRSTSALLTKS